MSQKTLRATQAFLTAKKYNILQWPGQPPDLNQIEHAFHLLKTKLREERPKDEQQLKVAAVKGCKASQGRKLSSC